MELSLSCTNPSIYLRHYSRIPHKKWYVYIETMVGSARYTTRFYISELI